MPIVKFNRSNDPRCLPAGETVSNYCDDRDAWNFFVDVRAANRKRTLLFPVHATSHGTTRYQASDEPATLDLAEARKMAKEMKADIALVPTRVPKPKRRRQC